MPNQLLRGLIFIILVFLVTSDLKEIISGITASSSISAFLQRYHAATSAPTSSHHHQRNKRHLSGNQQEHPEDDQEVRKIIPHAEENRGDQGPFPTGGGPVPSSMKYQSQQPSSSGSGDAEHSSSSDFNENESLDHVKRLNSKVQHAYAKRKVMKLNDEEKKELLAMKTQLTAVMQEWCLPKLVCELHAQVSERGSLTEAEKGLLSLIRETSLGTMGEVVSRYHFAAHMGQLISGVEGNGCHNFYPNCPLSGSKVLQMMKKVRIR